MNITSLKRKIVLGTVQLGLQYGINNVNGKPSKDEAFCILDTAQANSIQKLDTAEAYGDSINTISAYIQANPHIRFEIISKFISSDESLYEAFTKRILPLEVGPLYTYMFHRYSDYIGGTSRTDLLRLKHEGKIQKIGISLYSLRELKTVLNDDEIDVIQIPYNPFDASLPKRKLLEDAKTKNKEIHVRSVFLQGLFFKQPKELTGNLVELSEELQKFHKVVSEYNLNVTEACLNFALHDSRVDHVIIGVETAAQLQNNLQAVSSTFPEGLQRYIDQVNIKNDLLLNPSNWKV